MCYKDCEININKIASVTHSKQNKLRFAASQMYADEKMDVEVGARKSKESTIICNFHIIFAILLIEVPRCCSEKFQK